MNKNYKLTLALHQFTEQWAMDELPKAGQSKLDRVDYVDRIHKADWLAQLRRFPEQERVSILRDAFVTYPPPIWGVKGKPPMPIYACLIGMVCLDTQEAREDLFVMTLNETYSGGWIKEVVKPLGPLRVIDLIFQTVRDPQKLRLVLYEFKHTLLPCVDPEHREAVKQYYKKRDMEAREQYHPFSSQEEAEEYARSLSLTLEWGL